MQPDLSSVRTPTNPPTFDRRAPAKPGEQRWRLPGVGTGEASEPVCRWDFSEAAGEVRWSSGRERYPLVEMAGPVRRGNDGPGGRATLELEEGQWLRSPRAECPALNFHGANVPFTLVAWVRRAQKSRDECEVVAGMWNETDRTRQYCLFLNLQIWDSLDQACGHLSSTGAPSPGYKYCMEAAIGATPLALGEWHHVAFAFDGTWGRVYVDGRFDYRPGLNPFYWPGAINDGGAAGSDFTVGSVFRGGSMGNWFRGSLGGLGVYDVSLPETEVERLWRENAV